MKTAQQIFPYIIIAGMLIFWFKGCGENKTETVTIPEVKGKFETVYNPIPIPKFNVPIIYSFSSPGKSEPTIIESDSPIDKELMQRFLNANLNKDKSFNDLNYMFADAIKENDYEIVKEDENIKTVNFFKTQGKLLEFRQEYTIKERKAEIKAKNHFYLGGDVQSDIKLETPNLNAKAFLQNKKGDLFYAGYGTSEEITVGYAKKIW